jgi:catechol 2,3-dioxygenase-like lactoylglutathione lyase family enzyme
MDFGEVIGFGVAQKPDFWIGPRTTGDGFRESHIAFEAPDRDAVGAFLEAAVAMGAEVLHEGMPTSAARPDPVREGPDQRRASRP